MLEARVSRVRRTGTVQEDWVAWLPEAKDQLFAFTRKDLEVSYVILSVVLDDTLTLCKQDRVPPTREQAAIVADLFDRLAGHLRRVLRALYGHGCQFGTLPNVAPLRPDCFRALARNRSRAPIICIPFSSCARGRGFSANWQRSNRLSPTCIEKHAA